MAEIGPRSGKSKDFIALEAIVEHLQAGNYGSTSKRNQKKKEEDLSSFCKDNLEDPIAILQFEHKGIIRNNSNSHSIKTMTKKEGLRISEIGSSHLWVIPWKIFWHCWLSIRILLN